MSDRDIDGDAVSDDVQRDREEDVAAAGAADGAHLVDAIALSAVVHEATSVAPPGVLAIRRERARYQVDGRWS
jgi:hypothetical protein